MDLVNLVGMFFCASAAGYAALGVALIRGPREAGHLPIAMAAFAIGVWVLGGAVEMLVPGALPVAPGLLGHFVGTASVPAALLVAFRAYTGSAPSPTALALLLIVPAASLLMALTNPLHQLMWVASTVGADPPSGRPEAWGPWFLFVHAPYSYLVIGAALFKLLLHSGNVARSHRRGLHTLGIAALVPIAAVLAWDFGMGPPTMAFVPAVFTAMLPVFAWLILGERVIEFSPIAYEAVFQNMADPVVVLDGQGRVVSINHGAERLLNVRESGAFRQSLEGLFGDKVPEVYEALKGGAPRRLMTSSGRFLHVQASPIRGADAASSAGRVLMFRDVSDVEQAQAAVRSSEELMRTIFNHSVNGIVRLRWQREQDAESPVLRCVSVNGAAAGYLGAASDDLVGLPADELLELAVGGMPADDAARVCAAFQQSIHRGDVVDVEVRPRRCEGERWLRLIGEPVRDNVALTLIDVSNARARQEEIESIAVTDPLTGLLNRRGFEREAQARLRNQGLRSAALLFIDLNQFKQVNDRCGHDAGDRLLCIAAERLRTGLRSCDVVGRPGGDEFVALVPDVTPRKADNLAERLTEALEQAYRIGEETLHCSASIGVALYPQHATSLGGLLRFADEAMYRAKRQSGGSGDPPGGDGSEAAARPAPVVAAVGGGRSNRRS